jgi:MFS transporter, DHA1 family, multidrug resistance protein
VPKQSRPLSIYLAAGSIFAALAARGFLLPLRVHELGADKVQVGLLFAVFTVTAAGLSLPAGFFADRFGRRSLVLFAIVTGGISQLGLAVSESVEPMYAWQALGGLGGGASQAALFAALADSSPGSRLGRAMGWLTLAMQVGFLIGPALAGISLQWLTLQEVLAASGLLYGLALVMTLVGIGSAPAMDRAWDLITPLRQIVRQPGFLPVTVGLLGATLLWGTLQAYLPLYGKEVLSLPAAQIGYMIAIQAVANGLARIPGGRLVDRTRRRGPIVIVGLSVFALCLAVLPHLTGFWPTTLLLVASVPVLATVYIALSVVFTNLATEETRGVTMGIYGSVLYLGLGAGPVIFGTVMERSGYVAGFTACAVTGLLLAGLVAVLRRQPLRRRPSAAMPPAA